MLLAGSVRSHATQPPVSRPSTPFGAPISVRSTLDRPVRPFSLAREPSSSAAGRPFGCRRAVGPGGERDASQPYGTSSLGDDLTAYIDVGRMGAYLITPVVQHTIAHDTSRLCPEGNRLPRQ